MSDATIVAHLKGRHVMGVYPMLPDDTCWFLAVDFDETTWKEDVGAFVETCRQVGLRPAVERSRSGNGAHVWFFFAAPVAAATARTMGSYLITETMSRRHELGLGSYDRLFPNQDTMPRGGFGNLIALPLQHEPRRQGNTVFLDDNLNPLPNDAQWAFLASVQRIAPATVVDCERGHADWLGARSLDRRRGRRRGLGAVDATSVGQATRHSDIGAGPERCPRRAQSKAVC